MSHVESESPAAAAGRSFLRRSRGIRIFIRDLVVILVVAVIVSVAIKTYVVRSFYIPSGSMENTLQVNDRIVVNELSPKLMPIQHGDVVVFKDPGGWLPHMAPPVKNPFAAGIDWVTAAVGLSAPDSNDHLVKRAIGLPGDRVVCCNALGQLSVNSVPLSEPYLKLPAGITRGSGVDFSITVPPASLWVMGDNRYNSEDSRAHTMTPTKGFVPMGDVVGRAFLITWPVQHWTWLEDYASVFGGVATSQPGISR